MEKLIHSEKEIFIIGGPNGAGKSTAARKFLPDVVLAGTFLDADEIAREISPEDPEAAAFAAGRLLLERFRELVWLKKSFAVETTCAGRTCTSDAKKLRRRRLADCSLIPVAAFA